MIRATSCRRWASWTSSTRTPPRSSARPRRCGRRRWTAAAGDRGTGPGEGAAGRGRGPGGRARGGGRRGDRRADAALGDVDRQLAQLQKEQVDVNDRTAANWKSYVDQLTAAGVALPPAAQLGDPPAGLPGGLVPVAAASGGAQRGAAQLPRQPTSLLVLPAETIAAVTAAMGALGLPYAPGTAGPGVVGLRIAGPVGVRGGGHLAAGDPGGPVRGHHAGRCRRRAAGRPRVPRQRRGRPRPRGHRAGPETMLAADARAGAVVVRTLPGDQVLGIGRPSLGQRAPVAAPGPTGGALQMECGNTVYPPSYDGARQWGGYPNGLIPPSAMCPLGVAGHASAATRPRPTGRCRPPSRRPSARRSASPTPTAPTPARCGSTARSRRSRPFPAQQPRVGAGRRPLRGDRALRHGAVHLDEGQRRPVRLPPPRLGRPGERARGAVALGVRRDLSRAELSVAAPTVRTTHGGANPC